jgi:hypothetical protein
LEIELHIGLTAPASHHEHPADLQESDALFPSQVSCGVSLKSLKNLSALWNSLSIDSDMWSI